MKWNDSSLPWQNQSLPWKNTSLPYNNPDLPWKEGGTDPLAPGAPVLSATTIAEGAAVNSVIGTLTAHEPSGTYTFTITADPDSKFQIANDDELQVAASLDYETATSHSVTISADNGVDDPLERTFTINVTDVDERLDPPVIDLLATSDRGAASNDDFTNEPEPEFNITLPEGAAEGDTIQVYADGVAHGASHALTGGDIAGGDFDLGLDSLPDGATEVTVTITNAEGESDPSNAVTITIDTDTVAAPVLSLDAGSDTGDLDDDITSEAEPDILFTFASPFPEAGDVAVLEDDAGNVLGTATLGGGDLASVVVNAGELEPGTHTFRGYVYRPVVGFSPMSAEYELEVTAGLTFPLDFSGLALPEGVTFARSGSVATYFDNAGVLQNATANVPRFDHTEGTGTFRGILIEPAATNIAPNSNNLAGPSWFPTNSSVATAAQFTSPDGTSNGWNITDGGSFGGQANVIPSLSAVPYVISMWSYRRTGSPNTHLQLNNLNSSGGLSTSATITRKSYTGTPSAGSNVIAQIYHSTGNGSALGVFGMQVETGAVATSYIPTTSGAVTRNADELTFEIPGSVTDIRYTFDDASTQDVSVSPGSYTVPTNLNRRHIKTIADVS